MDRSLGPVDGPVDGPLTTRGILGEIDHFVDRTLDHGVDHPVDRVVDRTWTCRVCHCLSAKYTTNDHFYFRQLLWARRGRNNGTSFGWHSPLFLPHTPAPILTLLLSRIFPTSQSYRLCKTVLNFSNPHRIIDVLDALMRPRSVHGEVYGDPLHCHHICE
ncbi:hypothetical protein DFH06DRAFT_1245696 [Mycena polygramma]|nr:hypothetical protein DFH06DRAFT_1245696 [Mycena polygramma]